MDESELVEAIAADLFTYVLSGDFPDAELGEVLSPADLPPQYNEFDRLVNLHFLLQERVQTFVDDLADRLRGLKTETRTRQTASHGAINGQIDWDATYQHRLTSAPTTRSTYVVRTRDEEYAIPENLVLKKTVSIIDSALSDADRYLDPDHTWAADTWLDNRPLRDRFRALLERNHQLRQIPDLDPEEPTDRMILQAENARQPLYREAAKLLQQRQRYRERDSGEFIDLIESTLIAPEDRERLFELFVLFRALDALRSVSNTRIGSPTYHTLASGRDHAAAFDGTAQLRVYYDQTPSSVEFKALPDSEPIRSRSDAVHRQSQRAADTFFTETDIQNHTKRPDVLIMAKNQSNPERDYVVIEVKDSSRKTRIRSGITELLEYLSFLRRHERYQYALNDFGSGINGILVVQDLDDTEISPASIQTQSEQDLPIRVVQAGDCQHVFPQLLHRVFAS